MTDVSPRWTRIGGLVIAGLGFLITRLYVAETVIVGEPVAFGLVSLPPLVIGLGLTVYGVVLAVGRFSPLYVRTVTIWCLLGIVGLATLLVATQLGAILREGMMATLIQSQLLIGNLLLGGAVVGVLIGDRAAANARKREEIRRTANRAAFVNRLLRHDVLNAAAIIEGHAGLLTETPDRPDSVSAIDNAAGTIKRTINEVGRIASPNEDREIKTVRLEPTLERAVGELRESHPDREIRVDPVPGDLTVAADDRLDIVVTELVENALMYGGDDPVRVEIESTPQSVAISVVDGGAGLPADQRELLTTGRFPEYDDPDAGFGLQAVSLLVGRYGGQITTAGGEDSDDPHRVTVQLPREPLSGSVTDTTGISFPAVARATTTGLFAGVLMGSFLQLTAGNLPVIGALYSVSHAGIGWVTHLFHSVIFALLFATGYQYTDRGASLSPPLRASLFGLGWGTVLWFVAAGFVMPVWLLALGQSAMLPMLTPLGFVAHAIWGVALGWSYVLLGRSEQFEALVRRRLG
ncbi:HAMP domain-containing histidine kinase [Halonotius terrestris]|uniref:histidine kinase n=1 Tax=Halonotius terrestris TaxID=2487750 RepID=A0A8J8P693_9EURY|nr:HAMP domain-containing sensor histidine kinase [Halonotius terrestris]TQQ79259.1 HAMP domain-containing histidine kinase [Halonotius terrestris]